MVPVKTPRQVEGIAAAGKILVETLELLRLHAQPGVTTQELDDLAREHVVSRDANPSFLGYSVGKRVFPASVCVSIDDEVVHGIPSSRAIPESCLLKIDMGVELDGYFSDAAVTLIIGEVEPNVRRMVEVTASALAGGIEAMRAGNRVGDVSRAIERVIAPWGFGIVRDLAGHGVGLKVHEEPLVPNYGKPGTGPLLREGAVLALEPMVNMGSGLVKTKPDGWTVVAADGSLSAHFEHTVVAEERGGRVLTTLTEGAAPRDNPNNG